MQYQYQNKTYELNPLPPRSKNEHGFLEIKNMTGRQRRCLAEYWAPIFHGKKDVYNLSDLAIVMGKNVSIAPIFQLNELEHVYKERERCKIPVILGVLSQAMSCHRSSNGRLFLSSV